jgi:hypothetical protein
MTTTPSAADVLRGRIRKYFFVVFGMIGGVLLTIIVLATGLKVAGADAKTTGMVLGVAAPVLMLGVVISSWIAVGKLWRCPQCDKNVYWTVSWNMSLFASAASPNCPGCGVELFTPAARARWKRTLFILIGIGFAAGVLGAMANVMVAAKHKPTPVERPRSPG